MLLASSSPETRRSFARGWRAGIPFAIVSATLSLTFGLVAQRAGLGPVGAIVMSVVVFSGSAQFAALAVVTGGGSVLAGVAAAALVNSRFIPMSVALAPHLTGGRLRRGLESQAIVDPSWVLARAASGGFDRPFLLGCTAPQYLAWVAGTVVGAFVSGGLVDIDALGLDALFPAFFTVLLVDELRLPGRPRLAVLGALIALAAIPLLPPGLPVLLAALPALLGLTRAGGVRG